MKVSALIEYLTKYLRDNGDVDLGVEFSGSPKTSPPVTSNFWVDKGDIINKNQNLYWCKDDTVKWTDMDKYRFKNNESKWTDKNTTNILENSNIYDIKTAIKWKPEYLDKWDDLC